MRPKRTKGFAEGTCRCGNPSRPRQWSCKECHKWELLKSKFKISKEQYMTLLVAQGGKCAICGRPAESFTQKLAVDHDHSCCPSKDKSCGKCVRGLLCMNCNSGIGKLQDDPDILDRASKYLRKGGLGGSK